MAVACTPQKVGKQPTNAASVQMQYRLQGAEGHSRQQPASQGRIRSNNLCTAVSKTEGIIQRTVVTQHPCQGNGS